MVSLSVTLGRQHSPFRCEIAILTFHLRRLEAPHFWWGGCVWRWRFGEGERRVSILLVGQWRRRPEPCLSSMLLSGLHQQPVNTHQRQPTNQAVSKGPDRHGEGQPASIRPNGFNPVAGGRYTCHAPVPVRFRFEGIHDKGHPDAYWCAYASRRTGTDEAFGAVDLLHRRPPMVPGMRVRDQPPYAVDRRLE